MGQLTASVHAQTAAPIGEEFQVNAGTDGYQLTPDVAFAATGEFIVVWASEATNGLLARRFDADSAPLSSDFAVETDAPGREPAIAAFADSSFVVAWTSDGSSGDDQDASSIAVRRFDAVGMPLGAPFQANTWTTGAQDQPAVAVAPDGDFVVAWRSDGGDTDFDGTSIAAQRFDTSGTLIGSQFLVNSFTASDQARPSLVFGSGSELAVAWQSQGSSADDSDASSIALRTFDAAGTPVGAQEQVNVHTTGSQERPVISRRGDGFVVVWQGETADDSSDSGIAARRFGATGLPVNDELPVNDLTVGSQREPSVTEQPGGGFVVTWTGFAVPGDPDDSIGARFFAADGRPIGGELQVNTYTTEAQYGSAAASAPGGDFVVVWTSFGSAVGDADYAIVGQRFSADLFADGFESGDTSAW